MSPILSWKLMFHSELLSISRQIIEKSKAFDFDVLRFIQLKLKQLLGFGRENGAKSHVENLVFRDACTAKKVQVRTQRRLPGPAHCHGNQCQRRQKGNWLLYQPCDELFGGLLNFVLGPVLHWEQECQSGHQLDLWPSWNWSRDASGRGDETLSSWRGGTSSVRRRGGGRRRRRFWWYNNNNHIIDIHITNILVYRLPHGRWSKGSNGSNVHASPS